MAEDKPIRFGAEFGPESMSGTTKGVGLATFKRLVWISNLGGLLLVAIALEMAIAYQMFWSALVVGIAGVLVHYFLQITKLWAWMHHQKWRVMN